MYHKNLILKSYVIWLVVVKGREVFLSQFRKDERLWTSNAEYNLILFHREFYEVKKYRSRIINCYSLLMENRCKLLMHLK